MFVTKGVGFTFNTKGVRFMYITSGVGFMDIILGVGFMYITKVVEFMYTCITKKSRIYVHMYITKEVGLSFMYSIKE